MIHAVVSDVLRQNERARHFKNRRLAAQRSLDCAGKLRARIPALGRHRNHDVVVLFVEFQHELDSRNLVHHAEFDGFRRAEKIHRFGRVSSPSADIFEVFARLFLLKQNPHR